MPELPEVETHIVELRPLLKGRRIKGASVFWPRTIAEPDPDRFCDLIRNRRFGELQRRAKYMLLGLDAGWTLVVHLRMTGTLRVVPSRPGDGPAHAGGAGTGGRGGTALSGPPQVWTVLVGARCGPCAAALGAGAPVPLLHRPLAPWGSGPPTSGHQGRLVGPKRRGWGGQHLCR